MLSFFLSIYMSAATSRQIEEHKSLGNSFHALCPALVIGPKFPGQFPFFHYLGAGSGQIVEHQSLKGSLAQIFLDPYSKHVEDFLVKISCFFFAAGSGQMVEEESLNNFLEQVFQDPNPHEDRFTAQAQCQNLKLRKPQEPGKVETA